MITLTSLITLVVLMLKFMVVPAILVTAFWFIQVRYGNTDDLDSNNWMVKTFKKKV